jgi:proline iminopeptidase
MNPAPVSLSDLGALRQAYVKELGPDGDRQKEMIASAAYQAGDPEAVTARYRIHFKHALARQEDYERLMDAMHAAFIRQGPAGIVKSRAVEDRLYLDTWSKPGYDLLPRLAALPIPTLVIWGDHDFIPADTSAHIAAAIHGAKMVTLKSCGHFSYLECPRDVRRVIHEFFRDHELGR